MQPAFEGRRPRRKSPRGRLADRVGIPRQYYALDVAPPVANRWYGRLASLATGGLVNEQLTAYDFVGNPTGLAYSDHSAESFACTYNELDQLTAFGNAEGYGYLAPPAAPTYDVGSLQTKGSASYSYPAPGTARPYAPSSVSTVGGFGYDANGSRLTDPTYGYAYDVEGRLASVTQGGTTVLANVYDGDGLRLVRTAGGTTTHFLGDRYEVNPATGIATANYPFNGQAIAMKAGTTLSYLHPDHLGSLASASDASGGELGWARYWPYGGLRLSGGALPTDRLFTGQTRDLGNDAFYFFKARYYDATIGQFQVPDTALPDYSKGGPKDAQSLNRYAYVRNNPLRAIDPTGHFAALDPDEAGGTPGRSPIPLPTPLPTPQPTTAPTDIVRPAPVSMRAIEPPTPGEAQVVRTYGQQILAAADLYHVPPELVAAIVYQESTSVLDPIRDIRARFTSAHSIGLGNIHLPRAILVSPDYIPAPASEAELVQRLKDPNWNILYIAAILRQDADRANRYQNVQQLTDEDMAILATEYQIGLKNDPASGAQPNQYGLEVEDELRRFRQLFGTGT